MTRIAFRGVVRFRDVMTFEACLFEVEKVVSTGILLYDGDSVSSSDDEEFACNI